MRSTAGWMLAVSVTSRMTPTEPLDDSKALRCSSSRRVPTTRSPAARAASAMALPRPELTPVISQTFIASPLKCGGRYYDRRWSPAPRGQSDAASLTNLRCQNNLREGEGMEIGRRVRHLRAVRSQQKHWHGASPTTAMSHIAIQESLDGKPVEWLEKVTDQQYQSKAEKMNPSLPARRTLRTAASLLACLTMGGTLVACSSSPPSDTATDAHTGQDASSCSLDGSFHVTFAPVAGSPAACSCGECS